MTPLSHMKPLLSAVLLAALTALPLPGLRAQGGILSGDSLLLVEKTMKKLGKNVNFTVMPAPNYNTTQKLGFAILPVLVYNLKRSDTLSPPSSSGIMIYFNFYGSWALAARQAFFWGHNKWRASVEAGYGHLRMKYFGVGRDTVILGNADSNYVWSRIDGWYGSLSCYRRVVSKFYAGLHYNLGSTTLEGTDSSSSELIARQGFPPERLTESILVPSFIWDNRDNIFWSVRGYYATASFQFANSAIFSSSDYSIVSASANGYHRLIRGSNRLTLAWHFYGQAGWGDLPYQRMANYGKGDRATGTPGGNM